MMDGLLPILNYRVCPSPIWINTNDREYRQQKIRWLSRLADWTHAVTLTMHCSANDHEINKEQEFAEVAAVYIAYRRLH